MKAKEKLILAQKRSGSMICVGLDPVLEKLPKGISRDNDGIFNFCKEIIDSTFSNVCGYKVNTAFFEQYGSDGLSIMEKLFSYIPQESFIIADAKRADIGNTSRAYAKSVFEIIDSDAVTVNPYMGFDSISPFLDYDNKMVFILSLTSNKGSEDFQRLEISGKALFLKVIEKSSQWNRNSDIGYVAGATHPDDIINIRKLTSETLLIPGIGTQGGDIEQVLKANGGHLAVINSSRSIIYASDKNDFAEAALQKVIELNNNINHFSR